MRLSDKDRKLLIVVILLGITALGYFYLYLPFSRSIGGLIEDVDRLEARYEALKSKADFKDMLLSEIKLVRYRTFEIDDKLPSYLEQERIIVALRELGEKSGVYISSPVFTRVIPITAADSQSQARQEEQRDLMSQLKQLAELQLEEKLKVEEGDKIITLGSIPDGTGIKLEVKVNLSSTYDQFKRLLYEIANHRFKITAGNIVLTGQGSDIKGAMTLTFYGLMDRERNLPKWEYDARKGRGNLFEPFKDYSAVKSDNGQASPVKYSNKSYDFYMVLNPLTDDAPAVVLGKGDKPGSEIYSDGNKFSNVVIELVMKDSRYLFRYRTDYGQYPVEYAAGMEFNPVKDDSIVIKIISKEILTDDDKAGANIKIINKTDKKAVVEINKDSRGSRANIEFEGEGIIAD